MPAACERLVIHPSLTKPFKGKFIKGAHGDLTTKMGPTMSISGISGSVPTYQVPKAPQAKTDDERTESMSVKTKEAQSGKDSPAPVASKSKVDVKA
jgi:hypothetical protein